MENTAQHAIDLLRNRMTGDDLRQLSDTDLHQLEAICHHWQAMASTEQHRRLSESEARGLPKMVEHQGRP